ncbi:glycosyltransferase [Exiguobacterium sp. TBG-PICH-001]|uniref:glycosyltransferase family 2 protein n=1 Tax=Exiguobacterium abrahamii TaxID=2785532 RepID=UPI0018A768D5|nr:glycosyltransferase family 2 protein [Exiguobacterium sp. TBG-PICH-001]MBF8151989.1 glycosyltransferase [Exiguobacterium sp. TBG-PICH-001]
MEKNSISACMIVKNEEKHIEKCLKSLINQVDEIVIIDTGSTDKTIEISKQYTQKIYKIRWENNFSKARNYSLKFALKKYILIIDADEFLDEKINIKENLNARNADIYKVKINNELSNGGSYSHFAYRIFKNSIGLKFENALHEQLNLRNNQYTIDEIPICITHTGYLHETQIEKRKNERNLKILKEDILREENDYNTYNLGREYLISGNYNLAYKLFEISCKLNSQSLFMPDLLNKKAICLIEMNKKDEFCNLIESSIEKFPNETELYYTAGNGYLIFKDYEKAKEKYLNCIQKGENGYQTTRGISNYISYFKLAEIAYQEENLIEAFDYIVMSLKIENNYIPSIIKYFEITDKAKIPNENIILTFEILYKINSKNDLKKIIEILYHIRNINLIHYLEKYNVKVEKNIKAVALLLNRKIDCAYKIFMDEKKIPNDNLIDIFVLCLIYKNYDLLKQVDIDQNNKSKKILNSILSDSAKSNFKNENYKKISDLEIVSDSVSYILKLNQVTVLEELIRVCRHSSILINTITQQLIKINELNIAKILMDEYVLKFEMDHNTNLTIEQWKYKISKRT